jgi:hypothetical protein
MATHDRSQIASNRLSLALLACLTGSSTAASPIDFDALLRTAAPLLETGAPFAERKAALHALGDRGSSSKVLTERVFVSSFEADASCALDSDGDGLPDCVETNTGVFVDLNNTGTDPFNADTDGDGLSDGDEVLGTLDGLDLPALGVNPLRRDLLIEYDWFDDSLECSAHSHAPDAATLARVAAVFAAAPIINPDGSEGIHLIQDVGQGGALSGGNRIEGYAAILPGALDDTHAAIKQANFADNRRGYFHYVVMAHRYNGGSSSSGYAEVIGDDVIVSLYCLGTENNVTRTILHEIGHNLGLQHGGFEACNGKPNYNSVLNYRYQFNGLDDLCSGAGDNRTDGYSSGGRAAIDERALDEFAGVCGFPAIDWNRDGQIDSSVLQDLNPGHADSCSGASHSVLHDFDDWANITLLGIRDDRGSLKSLQQLVACDAAPPAG